MNKLRGPAGAGNVSHGGVEYAPDSHGIYEVPPEAAEILKRAHGFRDHDAPDPSAPSSAAAPTSAPAHQRFPEGSKLPPRSELLGFLKDRGIVVSPVGMSNEALAQIVRENIFVPPHEKDPDPPAAGNGGGGGTGASPPMSGGGGGQPGAGGAGGGGGG